MNSAHDYSTLKWIRDELNDTLQHARKSFEEFVEGSGGSAFMQDCASKLHQANGTLQMVQLYGAAMLAEEMERAVLALDQKQGSSRDESAEALMLALIQLPDYLERVQADGQEHHRELLPLLNDLRASREAPLLSEAALFAVQMEPEFGGECTNDEPNPDLIEVAKRARPLFHKGLIGWFRDQNTTTGLRQLGEVFSRLATVAGTQRVHGLFRVAEAAVEGLLDHSIEVSSGLKSTVGKLDQTFKLIVESGERAADITETEEQTKNLLFYVGLSDSDNPVINGVRSAFHMELSERSNYEVDAPKFNLLNNESLQGVQQALSQELLQLKDRLDLYMRGNREDLSRLQELIKPTQRVADTLGMVGQNNLRGRLLGQAAILEKVVEEGAVPNDDLLLDMASEVVYVESSLSCLTTGSMRAPNMDLEEGHPVIPQGEFDDMVGQTLKEATIDIAKVKEVISCFVKNPAEKRSLEGINGRFKQVAGALRMLAYPEAADILDSVESYVRQTMFAASGVPEQSSLDALADAISSVEYYMESVIDGRGNLDEIIAIAQQATTHLQSDSKTGIYETEEQPEASFYQFEELVETETLVAEEHEAVEQPQTFTPATLLEDIDEEILEIFIEEAREELEAIENSFPRWKSNSEDKEALSSFRRSYHTLKGSGRLVGAMTIGEYAWAVENLLNRVIDEIIEVTPELVGLLEQAILVLPELIDCQEHGRTSTIDVQSIMDSANALAEGRPLPKIVSLGFDPAVPHSENLIDPQIGEVISVEEPVSMEVDFDDSSNAITEESAGTAFYKLAGGEIFTPEIQPVAGIEPELFEIFQSEARAHLSDLHRFADNCSAKTAPCRIDERVERAFHTLHGSAYMAGVEPIARLSKELEHFAGRLAKDHIGLSQEQMSVLADGVELIELVLQNTDGIEFVPIDTDTYLIRLAEAEQLLASVTDEIQIEQEFSVDVLEDTIENVFIESSERRENIAEDEPEAFTALGADQFVQELAGEENDDTVLSVVEEKSIVQAVSPEPVSTISATAQEPTVEGLDDRDIAEANVSAEFVLLEGDPELVEIFMEEASELLDNMEALIQTWSQDHNDRSSVDELQRILHTLKGGARLAGLTPIGDLSHAFESFLTAVGKRNSVTDKAFDLVQKTSDQLVQQMEDVLQGRVRLASDLIEQLEVLHRDRSKSKKVRKKSLKETSETETSKTAVVHATVPSVEDQVDIPVVQEDQPSEKLTEKKTPMPRARQEQVRVRSDLLDRLVNNAGEVSIYRARLEQENNTLGFNLTELEQTVSRLHEQLRKLEIETEAQILFRYESEKDEQGSGREDFDPLELDRFSTMQQLSRSLMETVNDLGSIKSLLEEQQKETDTLLLQQARITTDLQDGLLRTRMVPFSQLVPRLRRLVRQTADHMKRKVDLVVTGAEGEMDRTILDRMVAPLEHLLRNAVSHGIEDPEHRHANGKNERGTISINLSREGADVVLTLADDGAGLNLESIRKRAIERGLLREGAKVTDEDIVQFVLAPGFSTAQEITQIAGRGVGMDVVDSEVKQLSGSLEIDSQPGSGTSFTIRLPLTLAISEALLIRVGEEVFAIPHTTVEGVVRIGRDDLLACYQNGLDTFEYAGRDYKIRYLGNLLGANVQPQLEGSKWFPLLLVRTGEHRVALQVEGLIGNRQIVVKSVGAQLSSIRWITGGTILGDGRVALILDVSALVRMDVAQSVAAGPAAEKEASAVKVMVVDDSITVRKVTTRLLKRHNMEVVTAKDGVDALTVLQEQRPDIMLLDIEMPRMDGFELARHLHGSEQLRKIPIIMITSRTGDKHRQRAVELGVKRYLGKPYQETDLLDNIYSVLAE